MARFHGEIGYVDNVETAPGVWSEVITTRTYSGDILKNTRRLESGDGVNNNITVNNTISVVADPYAFKHFYTMRYIKWMGVLWKITNIEVLRPRLILTIGGVYTGETS